MTPKTSATAKAAATIARRGDGRTGGMQLGLARDRTRQERKSESTYCGETDSDPAAVAGTPCDTASSQCERRSADLKSLELALNVLNLRGHVHDLGGFRIHLVWVTERAPDEHRKGMMVSENQNRLAGRDGGDCDGHIWSDLPELHRCLLLGAVKL